MTAAWNFLAFVKVTDFPVKLWILVYLKLSTVCIFTIFMRSSWSSGCPT